MLHVKSAHFVKKLNLCYMINMFENCHAKSKNHKKNENLAQLYATG